MCSSSHLRTIIGQILIHQKEVLFQKARPFPVPVQQKYAGSQKIMMHLCWLVPAGSWKATTHITLHYPSGLRISLQVRQSHREEINWKQCTGGDVVSQFPEYSSVMFVTCCAESSLSDILVPFVPKYQWCACKYVGKRGVGEGVLQTCILHPAISPIKDICFNRASRKHLYRVSFPHTPCIVLISSRGPVHSFLWPSKDFSLPFLLCKHFLVGVRKDQVPLCFLSPFCHTIKSKILSSFLIFILITVVATKTRSLHSN